MVCASPSPAPRRRWHRQFLALLPQIIVRAKIAFSDLRPEARAEMVQEVVCNAFQAFARLVQLKRTSIAYAAPLAIFGIKQARDGRKVGGHLNCQDISSEYCQRLKGLVVERLNRHDKDDENAWCEVLVEDRRAGPADTARMRLDFESWLASLPVRYRHLAQYLSLGNRTSDAARKFRVSNGRVSQIRKELAESWQKFTGEEPGPAAATAA
jgi:hypothetical protein